LQDSEYVVVGGGTAGCVVAARLAEGGARVTLLEAGPADRNMWIHIPAGVMYLLNNPAVTLSFPTEASPKADGRSFQWPRGRVLGGSGSINGMIFVRGSRADFDGWAQSGARGWSFDDVLPYFRSMEHYGGGEDRWRGRDGPLGIEDPRFVLPITRSFIEAAVAAGHKRLTDINHPDAEGVGLAQMNRLGRFRGSTARTFLRRAQGTGRLDVVTGAQVTALQFDGARCTGVTFVRGGTSETINATRETILSAGALQSPHLLQLAGIGDPDHLAGAGIAVRHALPGVGRNLQDHYGVRVCVRIKGARTINELSYMPRAAWQAARFALFGDGALTTGITAAMVFCRSREGLASTDLQLLFSPTSFDQQRFGRLEREPGASMTICNSRPQSRGTVLARSADPNALPQIAPNYLGSSHDMDILKAGIAEARRIFATQPLAGHVEHETMPAAGQELDDYIRAAGHSIYHPVGTCRMGTDPLAVVDPELRVRGIAGLRVVDASVMPTITSGNTNAPTAMIGEKAASMILADRREDARDRAA